MEFVEGQPIDQFAARAISSVRDRITLFRKVCAAVAHAHQPLIVHHGLKPGNILVLAGGTAKLLDQDPHRLSPHPSRLAFHDPRPSRSMAMPSLSQATSTRSASSSTNSSLPAAPAP